MKERIVITGGNGMIGSGLVKNLINDYEITVIDKDDCNIKSLLPKVNFERLDIYDASKVDKLFTDVYCVIHLAAAVHWTPHTVEEKELFHKINTEASEYLFRTCIRNKVKKVLFFSTNDVYSPSDFEIDENFSVLPCSIYGETKWKAERIGLELYRTEELPICIFRPSSVFGVNDRGSMRTLISLCKKGVIPVIGDGLNQKSLLYLEDVIGAVKTYLRSLDGFNGQVFNISSGNYTYLEMLDSIREVFRYKPIRFKLSKNIVAKLANKITAFKKLEIVGENKRIINTRMRDVLGYETKRTLSDALNDCHDYYCRME